MLYSGSGHRWQYGACALHVGYLMLQMHTLRLCNNNCFSLATMVAPTSLNVTLYVHSLSCSFFLYFFDLCLPTHFRCRRILLHLITLNDTHTHTHTHTLCWTPLDEWRNAYTKQTSTPKVGFEPADSKSARPHTYALDCAATGVDDAKHKHCR
jgi:hypothetical protein